MDSTPRAVVLQDISGFGRCSMTIALPVLSAMGCQCCPLPAAYLSTHTAIEGNTFLDMTGAAEEAAGHWKALGLTFDGVYTGFLGRPEQAALAARCLSDFGGAEAVTLIDPVLGDHGRLYRTCTAALCREMAALAARAQVITPNLTEAALLLGLAPDVRPAGARALEEWAARLSLEGRRKVVITGVGPEPGLTGGLCLDEAGLTWVTCPEEPVRIHGTGDLFASVLLGGLLRQKPLPDAARKAVDFTAACIRRTAAAGTPLLYGVEFEPLLSLLTG